MVRSKQMVAPSCHRPGVSTSRPPHLMQGSSMRQLPPTGRLCLRNTLSRKDGSRIAQRLGQEALGNSTQAGRSWAATGSPAKTNQNTQPSQGRRACPHRILRLILDCTTKVHLAKKPTHAVGFFVSGGKQSSCPVHFCRRFKSVPTRSHCCSRTAQVLLPKPWHLRLHLLKRCIGDLPGASGFLESLHALAGVLRGASAPHALRRTIHCGLQRYSASTGRLLDSGIEQFPFKPTF